MCGEWLAADLVEGCVSASKQENMEQNPFLPPWLIVCAQSRSQV